MRRLVGLTVAGILTLSACGGDDGSTPEVDEQTVTSPPGVPEEAQCLNELVDAMTLLLNGTNGVSHFRAVYGRDSLRYSQVQELAGYVLDEADSQGLQAGHDLAISEGQNLCARDAGKDPRVANTTAATEYVPPSYAPPIEAPDSPEEPGGPDATEPTSPMEPQRPADG